MLWLTLDKPPNSSLWGRGRDPCPGACRRSAAGLQHCSQASAKDDWVTSSLLTRDGGLIGTHDMRLSRQVPRFARACAGRQNGCDAFGKVNIPKNSPCSTCLHLDDDLEAALRTPGIVSEKPRVLLARTRMSTSHTPHFINVAWWCSTDSPTRPVFEVKSVPSPDSRSIPCCEGLFLTRR